LNTDDINIKLNAFACIYQQKLFPSPAVPVVLNLIVICAMIIDATFPSTTSVQLLQDFLKMTFCHHVFAHNITFSS
jgi:hypothetical protein